VYRSKPVIIASVLCSRCEFIWRYFTYNACGNERT